MPPSHPPPPFLPCPRNRPDGKQWLKFDDERVEKADDQKAIEDNWGGEGEAPPGGAPPGCRPLPLGQPQRSAVLASILCCMGGVWTTCNTHLVACWPPCPAGFGNPLRFTRHANAYMLVYVRESEWDAVMCQVWGCGWLWGKSLQPGSARLQLVGQQVAVVAWPRRSACRWLEG